MKKVIFSCLLVVAVLATSNPSLAGGGDKNGKASKESSGCHKATIDVGVAKYEYSSPGCKK